MVHLVDTLDKYIREGRPHHRASLAQQSHSVTGPSGLKAAMARNFRIGVTPDVLQSHIHAYA